MAIPVTSGSSPGGGKPPHKYAHCAAHVRSTPSSCELPASSATQYTCLAPRLTESMASVRDVPAEVLCSIFRYVNDSTNFYSHAEPLGWIPTITHVCQKWRMAALALPDIWAENICALASDAATDAFLERAKTMPLVFSPKTEHQVTLAEKHMSRLQTFTQTKSLPSSFIQALGQTTLSHLTILRLHRWDGAGDRSYLVDIEVNAPALVELRLRSVFFRVDAPLLRILDVMNDIQRFQYHGLDPVPTSTILSVLANTPLLENLRLEGLHAFDSRVHDDATTAEMQVELPKLRSLYLEDRGNDFGLFRLLRIPPTAELTIENAECETYDELDVTFEAVERHLRTLAYDMLLLHEEQDDACTHVNICLRSSTSSIGDSEAEVFGHGEPAFRLDSTMYYGGEGGSSLTILESFLSRIDVGAIRFLDIGDIGTEEFVELEPEEVREALVPFVNVSTVMINASSMHRHILALGKNSDEDDDDEGGDEDEDEDESESEDSDGSAEETRLVLPALQHLVVQDVSYEDTVEALKECWDALLAVLKRRKRAGFPIRYLTLAGYGEFPSFKFTGEELALVKEQDVSYVRRAEKLVDKLFDSRIHDLEDTRRLVKYVQPLQ
ncbi:unnamed protein product [Peniophora sp. CBMAI 1063]|nr:unnamed protein product [Peniophora sp. CBMAI 1063]